MWHQNRERRTGIASLSEWCVRRTLQKLQSSKITWHVCVVWVLTSHLETSYCPTIPCPLCKTPSSLRDVMILDGTQVVEGGEGKGMLNKVFIMFNLLNIYISECLIAPNLSNPFDNAPYSSPSQTPFLHLNMKNAPIWARFSCLAALLAWQFLFSPDIEHENAPTLGVYSCLMPFRTRRTWKHTKFGCFSCSVPFHTWQAWKHTHV